MGQPFYQKGGDNLEREYTYLTEQEMDEAVWKACQSIEEGLREKGLM